MGESEAVSTPPRKSVPAALVIALLPVFGYATAFVYEAGYFHQLDVPLWLIEVDIVRALVAAAGLLGLLLAFGVAAVYLPARIWKFRVFVEPILRAAAVGLITWGALYSGSWLRAVPWIVVGLAAVLLGLDALVTPLWRYRHVRGLTNKYALYDRTLTEAAPDTPFYHVLLGLHRRGYDTTVILRSSLAGFIVLFASWQVGRANAVAQTRFLVGGAHHDTLLIRPYRGGVLGVRALGARSESRTVVWLPLDSLSIGSWRMETVGSTHGNRIDTATAPARRAVAR